MNQYPGNERRNLVNRHLVEALRGAIAEDEGNAGLSQRLHAETKLRLIRMSDEDLWELAKMTSTSLAKSEVKLAYQKYKEARAKAHATAGEWVGCLFIEDRSHE